MVETRSKKRKRKWLISISSHVSSWPHVPATFESLNDDTLTTVLEFVGRSSYRSFGGLNYHCKEIYLASGMTKDTFVYGYAPLTVIKERYNRTSSRAQNALSKGVVFFNRLDVLDWALQERIIYLLKEICFVAVQEDRFDLLNKVEEKDWDLKEYIFRDVDKYVVLHDKLNVLKWLEDKGLSINKVVCSFAAVIHGHLHILQWLREEKGLELNGKLYIGAIHGNQLHVMKWLREQACPFHVVTFIYAAQEGNLDILQFLHDEDCPWPDYYRVSEDKVKPEILDWLHVSEYSDRIFVRR